MGFTMEEKKNLMSHEKLLELEAERDERKEVIRAQIAQKIKEAREQGGSVRECGIRCRKRRAER